MYLMPCFHTEPRETFVRWHFLSSDNKNTSFSTYPLGDSVDL